MELTARESPGAKTPHLHSQDTNSSELPQTVHFSFQQGISSSTNPKGTNKHQPRFSRAQHRLTGRIAALRTPSKSSLDNARFLIPWQLCPHVTRAARIPTRQRCTGPQELLHQMQPCELCKTNSASAPR